MQNGHPDVQDRKLWSLTPSSRSIQASSLLRHQPHHPGQPSSPPHRIPSRTSRHSLLPSPSSSPKWRFRSGQPPQNPRKASQSPEGKCKVCPRLWLLPVHLSLSGPSGLPGLDERAVVHLITTGHRSCTGCCPGCWRKLAAAWKTLLLSRKHSLAPPPATPPHRLQLGTFGAQLKSPKKPSPESRTGSLPLGRTGLAFRPLTLAPRGGPGNTHSRTIYSLST